MSDSIQHSMYCEVQGQGQHIVMLHGWGMHGGIWGEFKKSLAKEFTVHTLDLPGFGFSNKVKHDYSLSAFSQSVEKYIESIDSPVILLGWSLGGLIALNVFKRGCVTLDKIILIATTPCFTKKKNWSAAMDSSVFNSFSDDLKENYQKTLKRFLTLQTRGGDLTKDDLRALNHTLNERGEPNLEALEAGLGILSTSDLRSIHDSTMPFMVILGEKDTLVAVEAGAEFEKMFLKNQKIVLEKTGHLPFLTHTNVCVKEIKHFINA